VFAGTTTNHRRSWITRRPVSASLVLQHGCHQVSIGNGNRLAVNQPGSQLFFLPGNGVLRSPQRLIQALQSNRGYRAAVTSLGRSTSYLSAQRFFYGNAANQHSPHPLSSIRLSVKLPSSRTPWPRGSRLQPHQFAPIPYRHPAPSANHHQA